LIVPLIRGRRRQRICHRLDRQPEFRPTRVQSLDRICRAPKRTAGIPEPGAERIERLTSALSLLLQVDGLIVSGLVKLCTPYLVHALVVGSAEDHGRAEPNVEVAEIFHSPD
jgi:hypothetical protein